MGAGYRALYLILKPTYFARRVKKQYLKPTVLTKDF